MCDSRKRHMPLAKERPKAWVFTSDVRVPIQEEVGKSDADAPTNSVNP